MAKNYSRRDFIKSTLLSSGALFVAISPLKMFAQSQQKANAKGIDAAGLNKQAKLLFFQKKYAESTAIYKQIIAAYPDRISYYDGYARVLGAQQKSLAVAELYKEGLKNNPRKAVFMHRLSSRIQNLCSGNRKAELAFISKYGEALLFESAAQLMLDAIKLHKKNRGLYLNLLDILKAVEKKNNWLADRHLPAISFSETLQTEIKSVSAAFEQQWATSRGKHKPVIGSDVDANVTKIKNKNRRELYTLKEKNLREKSLCKARKEHLKDALEKHLTAKNTNKAEKYGMLVLAEQIDDTDTIGKLRKFYKNQKATDRLLSLNRHLYLNKETIPNTLALANSLVYHGSSASTSNEATTLLDKVKDYVDTLHPTAIANYYILRATILINSGNRADARSYLLEGIKKFNGRGGAAYAMMETYALSFAGDNLSKGEAILKTLCGQTVTDIDDDVWKYVKSHIDTKKLRGTVSSDMEQIKQYTALAKIQKKMNSAELATTSSIIAGLKVKVRKS